MGTNSKSNGSSLSNPVRVLNSDRVKKKSLAFTRLFKVFRKNYFTSKMLLAGFTSASKPLGSMVIFLMADLGLPIVNT